MRISLTNLIRIDEHSDIKKMQHKPLDLWPNNQLKSPHAIGLKKEKAYLLSDGLQYANRLQILLKLMQLFPHP